MGRSDFTWDAKQEAWVSELTTPRVHALWTFVVRGDEITGTLVDLPSKHLIRNVRPRRSRSRDDDVILKAFDAPDETRIFEKGRLDLVRVGAQTIGRAVVPARLEVVAPRRPARRARRGARSSTSAWSCRAWRRSRSRTAASSSSSRAALFHVPAVPHDSWVVGEEPYVSLHFLGAQEYARKS